MQVDVDVQLVVEFLSEFADQLTHRMGAKKRRVRREQLVEIARWNTRHGSRFNEKIGQDCVETSLAQLQ